MDRSFSPDDLVQLPQLDAMSAIALGEALLTAAKARKPLPKTIAKAHDKLAASVAALRTAAAGRIGTPATSSPRASAADRILDACWSALFDWLTGWSKLPDAPQAKQAAAILADVYPEGLKFTQLAYKLQWGESDARLELIKTKGHDDTIRDLGGQVFLTKLRASHKEYGEALGITRVPDARATATIRSALDAFTAALRKYALKVSAHVDDEAPETSVIAEALLEPLARWEGSGGRAKPGDDSNSEAASEGANQAGDGPPGNKPPDGEGGDSGATPG
jgi:hypothetical protein